MTIPGEVCKIGRRTGRNATAEAEQNLVSPDMTICAECGLGTLPRRSLPV